MGSLKYITLFSAFYILITFTRCSEPEGPLVLTSNGLVRGIQEGNISMFLSVPYAKVDEQHPFGPSFPYPKFETVFEANEDLPLCPQPKGGTLDCLRLNIHVPTTANSENLLPILVWIPGGGFKESSGQKNQFGPKFLLKHDIILVTINYRLSIYGFMCLDDPKVVGNQGIKDQHAALKWIKENIKAFGGDPDKITVAGESAGSISVDLHLQYDKERTFEQAILHSGTSLNPDTFQTPDYNSPFELASYMGLATTKDLDTALEFLAKQNSSAIIAAVNKLGLSFNPCLEKKFDGVESFLTEEVLHSKVNLKDISVMIGSSEEENLYFLAYVDIATYATVFADKLKSYFNLKDKLLENTEKIVRHFYIGDKAVNNDTRYEIADLESDLSFQYPIERTIRKYNESGIDAVYRYLFTYVGGRNFLKRVANITFGGASHADELGYLFDIAFFPETPTAADQLMIDRITLLWTNFIKHGNPNPCVTSDLIPVEWPAVTDNTMPYMDLGPELSIQNRPFEKRMALWDLFYTYWGLLKDDKYV